MLLSRLFRPEGILIIGAGLMLLPFVILIILLIRPSRYVSLQPMPHPGGGI